VQSRLHGVVTRGVVEAAIGAAQWRLNLVITCPHLLVKDILIRGKCDNVVTISEAENTRDYRTKRFVDSPS